MPALLFARTAVFTFDIAFFSILCVTAFALIFAVPTEFTFSY